jgi:hypothetical protein
MKYKRSGHSLFKTLLWNLPEVIEKITKSLGQGNQRAS